MEFWVTISDIKEADDDAICINYGVAYSSILLKL